jgi:hypothetical protein
MTNSSLVVTLGSTQPDSVNIISACFEGNTASTDPAPATPAGWTLLGYAWNGTTAPIGSAIYWRKYVQGDPATVTLTWANTGQAEAVCTGYAGVDTVNPVSYFTLQNQSVSSATKTTAALAMLGSGWICHGFADRTGTSDYTNTQEYVRGQRRNSSSSSIICLDTNRLIEPSNTVVFYTATGPNTSVGQNWIYRLQPADDGTWKSMSGRVKVYDGTRWSPSPKLYSPQGWRRA